MATGIATSTKITPEVLFGRNAKQLEAWQQSWKHRFLLYGGAAGGGKSFFLRWWCVFYLIALYKRLHIRGAQVLLACEDYPSLQDRQIGKIEAEFPQSLGTLCRGATRDFTLNESLGSGQILLRNLDDPAKYLSAEFAGIAVDELTRNEQKVFDWLRLRLRWPGVEKPRFVGGTNPGGKGHGWVKKIWKQHEFPPELNHLSEEFAFVQAQAKDNPFLSESYYDDLSTLPEAMRRPYLEGDWDVFQGQYFTNFAPVRHVVHAHELLKAGSFEIKPWDTRWISMDWGFEHATDVHWHTMNEQSQVVTYREYHTDHTSPRLLAEEMAERNRGEKLGAFYLSPDAFADRMGQSTIAQQLWEVLCEKGFPGPSRASDDRVGGWQLMYQLLENGSWKISDACPKLIECLPTLVHDEKKVEDVAKTKGDDPADSARYGLYSHLREAGIPFEVTAIRKIESIPQGTERLIESMKVLHKGPQIQTLPIKRRRYFVHA